MAGYFYFESGVFCRVCRTRQNTKTSKNIQERMSFPPFILPRLTVVWPCTDAAVQSVVDPCNIALYFHSKNPYLNSISRTSCNKYITRRAIYIYYIIIHVHDILFGSPYSNVFFLFIYFFTYIYELYYTFLLIIKQGWMIRSWINVHGAFQGFNPGPAAPHPGKQWVYTVLNVLIDF